jgi:hypothetical protein
LTIATNQYLEYWKNQVISVYSHLLPNHSITFHVFTNRVEEVREFENLHPQLNIKLHEIEKYGWPEATLLRYEIYTRFSPEINEEILMHLDADMLAEATAESYLEFSGDCEGMQFVAHPGYWRPRKMLRSLFYIRNPRYILKDVFLLLKYGSLGTWETNKSSQAYVKRKLRKNYACGGVWFGQRSAFLKFTSGLAESVRSDQQSGVMARWHDESHLNKWIAGRKCNLISPAMCHDVTYPNLRNIQSVITAVRKS